MCQIHTFGAGCIHARPPKLLVFDKNMFFNSQKLTTRARYKVFEPSKHLSQKLSRLHNPIESSERQFSYLLHAFFSSLLYLSLECCFGSQFYVLDIASSSGRGRKKVAAESHLRGDSKGDFPSFPVFFYFIKSREMISSSLFFPI